MKLTDIINEATIERLYRVRPLPSQYVRDAIDVLAMEVIGESYVWPGHVWPGYRHDAAPITAASGDVAASATTPEEKGDA